MFLMFMDTKAIFKDVGNACRNVRSKGSSGWEQDHGAWRSSTAPLPKDSKTRINEAEDKKSRTSVFICLIYTGCSI